MQPDKLAPSRRFKIIAVFQSIGSTKSLTYVEFDPEDARSDEPNIDEVGVFFCLGTLNPRTCTPDPAPQLLNIGRRKGNPQEHEFRIIGPISPNVEAGTILEPYILKRDGDFVSYNGETYEQV